MRVLVTTVSVLRFAIDIGSTKTTLFLLFVARKVFPRQQQAVLYNNTVSKALLVVWKMQTKMAKIVKCIYITDYNSSIQNGYHTTTRGLSIHRSGLTFCRSAKTK